MIFNYTDECLYKDTYIIITMMDEDMRNKISNKFINFLKENMNKDFEGTINNKIPLKNQELRYEVRLMLSLIYIYFMCDDETQKKLETIDKKNIQEFYNKDIFANTVFSKKNEDYQKETIEEKSLIEYKESLFSKICKKLKNIFNKK